MELCNGIGCISTEPIKIRTLDPPPNPWRGTLPSFEFINSSFIRIDWTDYSPMNKTNASEEDLAATTQNLERFRNVTYRLERADISFAYPPTPLEVGIRFHGFNYFKFTADKYFPEGYPYFGLKYSYKSRSDSALVYYAGSSFAQSELTLVQMLKGRPWFVSNTQSSKADSCSGYLSLNDSTAQIQSDANKWHTLRAARLNNFLYMRVDNRSSQTSLAACSSNQVITDVSSIYFGGLPPNYLNNRESSQGSGKGTDGNYRAVQSNNFQGCLKNASTLLEIDNVNYLTSNATFVNKQTADFDFDRDAESSAGEPVKSNTIHGCPLDLESEASMIYLMGFGYFFVNARQTMPIEFQTNKFLIIDFNFRTEFSQGLLLFNYDIDNDQFMFIRLLDRNVLEVSDILFNIKFSMAKRTHFFMIVLFHLVDFLISYATNSNSK
jgi:hypothetical protein